jgi:SAM-dependent methyltransferase
VVLDEDDRARRAFYDQDYPLLYRDASAPQRTDAEIDHLLELLHLPPGARILDLCCGQGRHAVRLAQRGYRVTGLDYSAPLLALAREAASRLPAQTLPPRWVLADARALPLRAQFDAVVCLYNSLNFVHDAQTARALRQAASALSPGGQLLLDLEHRDVVARLQQPSREWRPLGEARVLVERNFDAIAGISSSHITVLHRRPDGTLEERQKLHRFRAYSGTELKAMVEAAGFTIMGFYGEYDRRPFRADSPLALIHARAGYEEL